MEAGSKTFCIYSQPYLDKTNQCYKNIVTVNTFPKGPLGKYIKRQQFYPLSPFKVSSPCSPIDKCGLVIRRMDDISCSKYCDDLLTTDEIPNLISYLLSSGYKIDTSITKMFNTSELLFNTNNSNKLVCFATYEN